MDAIKSFGGKAYIKDDVARWLTKEIAAKGIHDGVLTEEFMDRLVPEDRQAPGSWARNLRVVCEFLNGLA